MNPSYFRDLVLILVNQPVFNKGHAGKQQECVDLNKQNFLEEGKFHCSQFISKNNTLVLSSYRVLRGAVKKSFH